MKKYVFHTLILFISVTLILSFRNPSDQPLPTGNFNDSLFCLLEEQNTVVDQQIIRNELYTWTSKEQINVLRNSKQVLLKSQSEKYGKANYDLLLDTLKSKGDPIAAFLLSPQFAKKRFAWPQPWATVRGYPNESYGDQLLKITFKEDAIFGSFISYETDTTFRFYSMKGKQLDPDFVMAHPERLAVVYFVNGKLTTKKEAVYRGTYSRHYQIKKTTTKFPYREYVICNEGMIKEWSYGTQNIHKKINHNIQYLNLLIRSIHTPVQERQNGCYSPPPYDRYITSNRIYEWSNYPVDCCHYFLTIALVNEYYDLSDKQLKKTISALNVALKAQGDSIVVKN